MHSYRQIESIQRRGGAVIDDLLTRESAAHRNRGSAHINRT